MRQLQSMGSSNLREQVLERVRSEIVSGRTPPGAIYSVPGLAAELGVSTTPVREALLELSRRGLVAAMRNRGFRVEPLSLEALDQLFAMRELLERYALETLCRQGLDQPEELIVLADKVADAVASGDVLGYIATDRAFHEALVERAGNPLLSKMVMQLRDDMRLYGIDSKEGLKRQKASVKEHYQMVEYAVKQDAEKIGTLISQHILSWRPLFSSVLRSQASEVDRKPLMSTSLAAT
jgi:DNA-binding GntR family transcriptional regulator